MNAPLYDVQPKDTTHVLKIKAASTSCARAAALLPQLPPLLPSEPAAVRVPAARPRLRRLPPLPANLRVAQLRRGALREQLHRHCRLDSAASQRRRAAGAPAEAA